MENRSNGSTEVGRAPLSRAYESRSREDCRRARAAYVSLQLLGMPRVNVLLIGIDGMVWNVLRTLLPDLREPITSWCPGERLVLPREERTGTLILHDVGAMAPRDQLQLLGWLQSTARRTQVVSMTSVPLLPRVRCGAFLDALFYRLNIVSVDVTAPENRVLDAVPASQRLAGC